MIELPILDIPHFIYRIVLDGIAYRLQFDWNSRESSWSLTIRDNNEVLLASNLKIVPWINLIGQHPQENLPPGAFILIDTTADFPKVSSPLNRNNLGNQFVLIYVTEEELTTL